MKIVGDVLIIETSDPDELRREVNRVLGDEPLTVQAAAKHPRQAACQAVQWGRLPHSEAGIWKKCKQI